MDDLQDLNHKPAEVSASLVQSWLLFGLLADLTGTPTDRQSVLHHNAHRPRILLRIPLNAAISDRPELGDSMASKPEQSSLRAVSLKIRDVVQIGIDNVKRIDRLGVAVDHLMPFVLLSVKILLCDLAAMRVGYRGNIYSTPWNGGLNNPSFVPHQSGSRFVSSSTKTLEGLMMDRGWCPSHIHRIGTEYDYSLMHHLSCIDRRTSEKTNHDSCSQKHCDAYNSAPDSYVTSQRLLGCQCSSIASSSEDLNKILESGGIPLISLHEAPHGKFTIRVHETKANSQYTALSHVWSGGLGNVQANSLPLCQLKYLSDCLSSLPKHGETGLNYKQNLMDDSGRVWISPMGLDNLVSADDCKSKIFWMDTLCIPIDPKSSDLRMKAINKMDAVYAHVRRVLVLDLEIQKVRIRDIHPCELLARLAYSSWMGRSWTLQEGAIGGSTYFQCADGAITLEHPGSMSYSHRESSLSLAGRALREARSILQHRPIKIDYSETAIRPSIGHKRVENVLLGVLLHSLHRGRNFRNNDDAKGVGIISESEQLDSFVSIWNDLSKRSTTKAEDIFAIFANLLDFNAGQIIKLPQEERVKSILWSSDRIPFSILYNSGPKSKDGKSFKDRWVPTVPKGSKLNRSPFMIFAEDGRSLRLAVEKPERQLLTQVAELYSLPLYCYLLDGNGGKTYFIKALRSATDTVDFVSHQSICIVIEHFGNAKGKEFKTSPSTIIPRARGACFFITSTEAPTTMTPEIRVHRSNDLSDASAHDKTSLSTVYDCPVRVWEVIDTKRVPESEVRESADRERPINYPVFQCKSLDPNNELHLETGICERLYPVT